MKDSFYTSSSLANILLDHIDISNIDTIADFCVGGGELLRSAKTLWPQASVYGTDISEKALSLLKEKYPDWHIEYCDFIEEDSRQNCTILNNNKFELVLLNPPFTCKGSTIHKISFKGVDYNVSTAMLFLLEAINYITTNGVIYAILPISAAYSQKDLIIWKMLEKDYNLVVLEERDKQHFKNCYPPNIILVSLNDFSKKKKTEKRKNYDLNIQIESIVRGQLSMNEIIENTNSPKCLIHSTNLRDNKIVNIIYRVSNNNPTFTGPGVVIHRVGNPKPSKICTLGAKEEYVFSDCVILIKTRTHTEANKLKKYIIRNWISFEKLYKGTGAKYVTLSRLKDFFQLGVL